MAAILVLVARHKGRLDFQGFAQLSVLLDQAELMAKAHQANLEHWIQELRHCELVRLGSPGWIVMPPGKELPPGKLPPSRPAYGYRLCALVSLQDLIAAGWEEPIFLEELIFLTEELAHLAEDTPTEGTSALASVQDCGGAQ